MVSQVPPGEIHTTLVVRRQGHPERVNTRMYLQMYNL